MIILNAILYLSSTWYSILSFNQCFINEILPYWFVVKISEIEENIFFNFCFTENMIFTLSVYTKMLLFMQCLGTAILRSNSLVLKGQDHIHSMRDLQ